MNSPVWTFVKEASFEWRHQGFYIVYNFITVKSSIKLPGGLFISGPFEGRGGLVEWEGLINFVPMLKRGWLYYKEEAYLRGGCLIDDLW